MLSKFSQQEKTAFYGNVFESSTKFVLNRICPTLFISCCILLTMLLNLVNLYGQNETDDTPKIDPLQSFEKEFIKIIRKVSPSVVSIELYCENYKRISSGVILDIDSKKYIVTVANASRECQRILVNLGTGEKYSAVLIGTDSRTNLAILKMDTPNLQPVERGNSDELQVGAFLIIIGNPYGLEKSVAYGIVSGLHRTVQMDGCDIRLRGVIQTTVPINPGDAGGLIVDSSGRFVGMASSTLARNFNVEYQTACLTAMLDVLQKLQQREDVPSSQVKAMLENLLSQPSPKPIQGINFILPSNTIYWVAEQIILHGKVRRGWVGIEVKDNEASKGVVVVRVSPNSPAARQGIQVNDHLIEVDEESIIDSDFLLYKISHALVQQKVCFTLLRNGQKHTVVIELTNPPQE